MKTIMKVLLFVVLAIGASSITASAQKKRADKTSSARAYYGQSPAKPNYKPKKTKKVKAPRSQSSKRATAQSRNRRKFS